MNAPLREAQLRRSPRSAVLPLSNGEVNFLWWFIQGSIMQVDVRRALWRGWGLCQRHALGWLCVEAAFRNGYLHGPAIVYAELMARARDALQRRGPLKLRRAAAALRAQGPCHMCDLGYGPASPGRAPPARMRTGTDPEPLRAFVAASQGEWMRFVCGRCVGSSVPARCRVHLLDDLERGVSVDLDGQQDMLQAIAFGADRYQASFQWERRGTETAADRAAFVAAVGWCSGWHMLCDVLDGAAPESV
jgi:hypothetical protein